MENLDPAYGQKLEDIKKKFLDSPALEKFLDTEEEEDFQTLRELFEISIADLYEEVAIHHPLQLPALEDALLDESLEGLFTPKLLGYSVLRGNLSDEVQYTRPQDQFKKILLFICNSANFDFLKKRIGQTVQIGFALSSDIWITNLINEISNKKIRYFLQNQKLKKYRDAEDRLAGLRLYQRQFRNDNFYTAHFPTTVAELNIHFPELFSFLTKRIELRVNNSSFIGKMIDFLQNDDFYKTPEYLKFAGLFGLFFDTSDEEQEAILKEKFNALRKDYPEFEDDWFAFLLRLHESDLILDSSSDMRLIKRIDFNLKDQLAAYYQLAGEIHSKGYMHEEVIENVRVFHSKQEGLSDINECVRLLIFGYFDRLLQNLEETDYPELFEQSKFFQLYISIFNNELFNKRLKDSSLAYVQRLLKFYTDKRGRDYQDIKKFVSATFQDLGFLNDKQVVELFKTRRKKKVES